MTPTQRSLDHLRKSGYLAAVVEKWNPHVRVRQDLFGFADIIAVHPFYTGVLFLQCTSGPNHSSRVNKVKSMDVVGLLLETDNRVEVWSWQKRGQRGKRKTWQLRREEVLSVGEE